MADRVEQIVLALWARTRMDWGFATDRMADAFRRERGLGSKERRRVAETLYGMIRQSRRLDFALEGAGRLEGPDRDRARLLAYRLLDGEIGVADARARLPAIDWGVVATVDDRTARERDPVRRLGLRRSLPDLLARRFLAQFGNEAEALSVALNQRAPLSLRVNTLKTTREALVARLAEEGLVARPMRFAAAGLVLETRVNVFGLAAFQDGLFEAQDEASQLVAELCEPPRGLVVDACAGAGGKTLALGALMGSRGRLVALDVAPRKLDELRRRARRAGLTNVRAVEIDREVWPDEILALEGRAERVLVDAPCSGVGALRRNPEARWRLDEEELARLPVLQEAIARRAARLVAPGGLLVYATCTVLREENEAVVERLLAADLGFDLVPLSERWPDRAATLADPSGRFLAMRPDRHDTDGFFAAVLRRR